MAEDSRARRGGDDRRGGRGGYGRSEGGRPEHRGGRDDRPRRFEDRESRPNRDRDDRQPRRFEDRDDRPKRYDDRADRPRRDRDDRPPRDRDDRPKRHGDRDDRPRRYEGRDDRPRRQGDRDDRPRRYDDRADRPPRDRDDRPQRSRDDRPPRSRDDRPQRSRDDRPRRDRDDRPRRGQDDRRRDRPRTDRRDDRGDDQYGRDGKPRRGKDALRPLEEREAGHEGPIRLGESDEAPNLPEGPEYGFDQLDREIKAGLRSLNKQLAEAVGNRLIATAALLEAGDAEGALVQARYARRKASRVAAVREVTGVAAYSVGEWQLAMNELRAAERLGGNRDHVAMIADCERATGHPDRAIDLYRQYGDDKSIDPEVRVELLIVAAGARRDMGMGEAATAMLKVKALDSPKTEQWVARLRFAYAEQLIADGREDEAREWLSRAVAADEGGVTGAAERLLELEGVDFDELEEEPDEDNEETIEPEESDDATESRE